MKVNPMSILKISISVFLVFITHSITFSKNIEDAISDKNPKITFAVLTDVHIMCPDLLKSEGKAFKKYLSTDRKLLKEGPALMDKAVSEIINNHPRFVLICGDLTKDGESDSHYYLVNNFLSRFKKANIKVYVIPGNHDVNNPHAVSFDKDTFHRVNSLSPIEFSECYADYGYRDAIAHDTASLTYVAQLSDSIRLIAIDDCKYEYNDFEKNTCVTGGRIKPQTLKFIKEQAKIAHKKGMRVISMMHHGLVQHWKWQDKVMPEYLVDNWKKRVRFFRRNNINVIFTGHFHSQDISERHNVYDIETGSTVTYPCPYRMITINNEIMKIQTRLLHKIDFKTQKNGSVQKYAADFIMTTLPDNIEKMIPITIPDFCRRKVANAITEAYLANLAGDEHASEAEKQKFKEIYKDLKKSSKRGAFIFNHIISNLSNDEKPQDNNCEIPFK